MIGWKLSLDLAALDMAIAERRPTPGFIHHSDRGVQCTCAAYGARLDACGARRSMCGRGTPHDNARAESFSKTPKSEEVNVNGYTDFDDAMRSIDYFMGIVCNPRRLHSSLGCQPPAAFEDLDASTPLTNSPPK